MLFRSNALGLQTEANVSSNEFDSTHSVARNFGHAYDLAAGTYTRTGPDGVQTFVQVDAANRVTYVRRGPQAGTENGPIMEATVAYNSLGLLTTIIYGTGAKTEYQYDLTRQVTLIKHSGVGVPTPLQMVYTYTADDLPATITESGTSNGGSSTVTFTYDKRRRLVHETRTPNENVPGYDWEIGRAHV